METWYQLSALSCQLLNGALTRSPLVWIDMAQWYSAKIVTDMDQRWLSGMLQRYLSSSASIIFVTVLLWWRNHTQIASRNKQRQSIFGSLIRPENSKHQQMSFQAERTNSILKGLLANWSKKWCLNILSDFNGGYLFSYASSSTPHPCQ